MRISDWSSDVCSSDLVGADDADDGARRSLEAEVVDQQLVAEGLADALRLDHQIAQARSIRNADAARLRLLVGGLRDQRLVGLDAGLRLSLAGARGLTDPLQVLLQHPLAPGLCLSLLGPELF